MEENLNTLILFLKDNTVMHVDTHLNSITESLKHIKPETKDDIITAMMLDKEGKLINRERLT